MTRPGSALMVVDVQAGMFGMPTGVPHGAAELIGNLEGLVRRAREAQRPIIYVRHDGAPGHPLERGTPGNAIADEIAPKPGDILIPKTQCGVFSNADVTDTLEREQIKQLVVCGLQTEFCVDAAIRGAAERGFSVIAAAGAHSTFDSPTLSAKDIIRHHEAVWSQAFGAVKPAQDISFSGDADASA